MTKFQSHVLSVIAAHYPENQELLTSHIGERLLTIERDIRRQYPQAEVSGSHYPDGDALIVDYWADKEPGGGDTGRARVLVECVTGADHWRVQSVELGEFS